MNRKEQIRELAQKIITSARERLIRDGADPAKVDLWIKVEKHRAYRDAELALKAQPS